MMNISKPKYETMITVIFSMLLISVLAFYIIFGLKGVDFGEHWDESKIITSVNNTFIRGIFLPGWYNYPSLLYDLSVLFSVFCKFILVSFKIQSPTFSLPTHDNHEIQSLTLTLRSCFFLFSTIANLAIYLSCRTIGISRPLALSTVIISLCSFQVFYHSRWLAPDTLLYVAGSLNILAGLYALRNPSQLGVLITTCAASIACSAKYPGGIFILIPAFLICKQKGDFKQFIITLFLFFTFFVFLTPGILAEPIRFFWHIKYEIFHYSVGGHGTLTINKGWTHLFRMLDFLTFRATSSSWAASLVIMLLTIIGGRSTLKNQPSIILILCVLPFTYILYFSAQKVMIVRNLLVILPFMYVLLGAGMQYLSSQIGHLKTLLLALFGTVYLLMCSTQTFLESTMSLKNSISDSKNLINFIESEKNSNIVLSKQVNDILKHKIFSIFPSRNSSKTDVLIYVLGEFQSPAKKTELPEYWGNLANKRGVYTVLAGPNEIDLDYYPMWSGKKRIVMVRGNTAKYLMEIFPTDVGLQLSTTGKSHGTD